MLYSCTLYKNTGFNATNIPDSINILNQCSHYSVDTLNIMQERNLNTIKVKTTWDSVKDVDYCILGNSWVYAVVDINMEATDVAVLSVVPDYINSTGGIGALNIIDGITERVHVSDDSYAKYDEEDPLLTPAKPLKITGKWIAKATTKGTTAIEATVNPCETYGRGACKTYGDPSSDVSVTVPRALPITTSFKTTYKTPYIGTTKYASEEHGTGVFDNTSENDIVAEAVSNLRSLGLEQTIIHQVRYPSKFISFVKQPYQTVSADKSFRYNLLKEISGKSGRESSNINYIMHSGVKNQRINYSNLEKYGIITCSGESGEFEPASVFQYDGNNSPNILYTADPHPDGKPYFRFQMVNGDASGDGFWRNCVGGMPWKQVPLMFTDKSGSALDVMRFENQAKAAQSAQEFNMAAAVESGYGSMLSGMSTPVAAIASMLTGGSIGNIGGSVHGLNNLQYFAQTGKTIDEWKSQRAYENARRSELLDFAISQSVVVPTVNFPYNTETIRDLYGNGVYVYRYYYDDADVSRIDKLLTMYGYKYSKPLETSDFTNRLYFNFVQAKNISVTGHAAWINDGIAEQLKAGVRVWHVLPSHDYYNNNPIK